MNTRNINKAITRITHLPKGKYLLLYIMNKVKHFYLKRISSTTVAFPATVMLELTNHCNLHCTTCPREYDFGKAMDKGNMQVHQAKKIIDELWPYLDSIGLTGMGETFLYKDIEHIVDYIKSKNRGIIISVSTNAVLSDFIDSVTKLVNKIDTIQVSIDGIGSVYEKIRKPAHFSDFDHSLRALTKVCKNSRTTLQLNMVVTKENYFQMPAVVKYSHDIGIPYVDFTLFNLASVTSIERSYYDFYASNEFLSVVSELEQVSKTHKTVTVSHQNLKLQKGFQTCPFPWTHFYVCWNGFIAPCCAKPFPKELNFGNMFDISVMDVLNSNQYKEFRKLWFENKTPDFCKKCHFIGSNQTTN